MNLNSTNIQSILGNLSCCIGAKGLQAVKDSKLGNSKCYNKNLEDIVLLDNIYKILKQSYYTQNAVYANFEVNPYKFPKQALGIALYINDELITYGETDPNSDLIGDGLDQIFYNIQALNNGTYFSYTFIEGVGDLDPSYYSVVYYSDTCELQDIKLQLYYPYCDSPPIGCDYDPALGTPYGMPITIDILNAGCCPKEFCYVSEDLETLYNMALNLCQICKNC